MEIVLGIALTCVVIFFISHLTVQILNNKNKLAFYITTSLVIIYILSFQNNLFLNITWSFFLIPQITFLVYVFYFMVISLLEKTNKKKYLIDNLDANKTGNFVSIVVAVHNEENVVARTIENLLNLDYPKDNYDITFIDDFSNDRTLEILKLYNNKVNVIDRSIQNEEKIIKRGKPSAINEVIDKLNGDLICILDADSVIEKDFLVKLIPRFKNEKLGIVQARNIFYNEKSSLVSMMTTLDIYSAQRNMYVALSKLGFCMFEGRAGIIRKKVFEELKGFDVNLPGEDYDLAYRVNMLGYEVKYEYYVNSKEQVTETLVEWFNQRKRWLGNHVLTCLKNFKELYSKSNMNRRKRFSATFFISNLLWGFTFNLIGPLILISKINNSSMLFTTIFIIVFSLTVLFFCCSYIFYSKRYGLLLLVPAMIIYYWIFTILKTWILINEVILKIKLNYSKASHRKPHYNEV